jgi:hypothetical protein
MNGNSRTAGHRDALLETFVAELTRAAYGVALRHGTGGTWVDLELDLWRALADTVQKWARSGPQASGQAEAVHGDGRDALSPRRDARLTLRKESESLMRYPPTLLAGRGARPSSPVCSG